MWCLTLCVPRVPQLPELLEAGEHVAGVVHAAVVGGAETGFGVIRLLQCSVHLWPIGPQPGEAGNVLHV